MTCFDPLKIYLFKDGLARFATKKYSTNPKGKDKKFVHLTNYSINKKNDDYVRNNADDGNAEGGADASKWNFK